MEEEIGGKKRNIGLTAVGRKKGEEIVISQAIGILNPPRYGVSYMHIKLLTLLLNFMIFYKIWVRVVGTNLGEMWNYV